jgi:NADPH-ferrihemoprotein reductase
VCFWLVDEDVVDGTAVCCRGGKDAYKADIVGGQPSLADLLERFPSCKPPLEHLLEALPPLATRLYSLTSSSLVHPSAAHVAFSVVKFSTERYGEHAGVATNWIKRKWESAGEQGARLAVFLRPNEAFRPPADLSAPLIMVGPGTGVAPFRGFLQERAAKGRGGAQLGPSWLFFGCRKAEEDFLYRGELEGFAADGHLGRLVTAFSREGKDKVYVQHRMREHGAELSELILAQGAYVMVCGDGAHMAKDVNQCLVEILVEHGGLAAVEANAKLAEMTKARRYVRDIWS